MSMTTHGTPVPEPQVSLGSGDMWKKKVTRGAAKVHEHTTFDVAPAQDSTERRKKDTVCTCAELLLLLFPRSSDVIYIATCDIFTRLSIRRLEAGGCVLFL